MKIRQLEVRDKVVFRNGGKGEVIMYPSGALGISVEGYSTLCEPLSNYEGYTHSTHQILDIVEVTS